MIWSLRAGAKKLPLCTLVPDKRYPWMYRVHWGDDPPSDMANLTRSMEAARLKAEASGYDSRRNNWTHAPAPRKPAHAKKPAGPRVGHREK